MSTRLKVNAQKLGGLALLLVVFLAADDQVEADEPQPLERVVTIELKGAIGALDHLFVDSKSARLFLANQTNNTLDVVDLKGECLLKQIPGQYTIHGVVYAPDLDRIFVGNGNGVCNVLDGKLYSPIKSLSAPGADSVRYDPRTNHVFVTTQRSLTVIDGKALTVITKIELPGSPHGFQLASKHPRVYVNVGLPNQVVVIDSDKNEIVARYPVQGTSKGIGPLALDEPNGRIFVGLRANPRLAVLDIDSGKEIASLPIPETADDMFLDAQVKRIYISCNSGFVADISQIDADHYAPVATVATAKGAKTSFYDPAVKRLYVAVPRQPGKAGPEIWVYQLKRR
jgi:DNA-binding beta-propeller fold protein YncE